MSMHIRTTTDPISQHEVSNPESHPCVYDGDGENGLEIYFETEENKEIYLRVMTAYHKFLNGEIREEGVR
jgi:hypothetical protein